MNFEKITDSPRGTIYDMSSNWGLLFIRVLDEDKTNPSGYVKRRKRNRSKSGIPIKLLITPIKALKTA